MKLFSYVKVTCNYIWQSKDDSSEYTYGSVHGALTFLEENKDELRWCSVEGYDVCPCYEGDEGGRLYHGMTYFKYWTPEREQITNNTDEDTFIAVTI